jgi:DnaJ-class molecular chaperone
MRAPVFDYYAVLGVERTVGASQLRRSYRLLALQFHPDRAGIQSTEVFQRIAEAYRVLSDVAARAAYDQRLRAAESSRFGRRDARHADDVGEGDVYGPGGKVTWRRGGRERHRADDLIDRLCGPLDGLIERRVVRRTGDGMLEILLERDEAAAGGTAAIDTSVDVVCPTCYGGARAGELWCVRCDYAGTTRENVTVCVPIPAAVSDGCAFSVETDPHGRAPPMRVRIRVT